MSDKFYQVRIDEAVRAQLIDAIPWGYQGKVVETLFQLLLQKMADDGPALTVAKLIDGRYVIANKFTDPDGGLKP